MRIIWSFLSSRGLAPEVVLVGLGWNMESSISTGSPVGSDAVVEGHARGPLPGWSKA